MHDARIPADFIGVHDSRVLPKGNCLCQVWYDRGGYAGFMHETKRHYFGGVAVARKLAKVSPTVSGLECEVARANGEVQSHMPGLGLGARERSLHDSHSHPHFVM